MPVSGVVFILRGRVLGVVAVGDTAFGEVIWRHFYRDFIAWEDADVSGAHLARDVGHEDVTIGKLNPKSGIRQGLKDCSVLFNGGLFPHEARVGVGCSKILR